MLCDRCAVNILVTASVTLRAVSLWSGAGRRAREEAEKRERREKQQRQEEARQQKRQQEQRAEVSNFTRIHSPGMNSHACTDCLCAYCVLSTRRKRCSVPVLNFCVFLFSSLPEESMLDVLLHLS